MIKIKEKKLTLKDRDIEILKYLYQMGFITSYQAFLRFWLKDKDISKYRKMLEKLAEKRLEIQKYKKYRSRTAYQRLQLLDRFKFVKRVRNPMENIEMYLLGDKGEAKILALGYGAMRKRRRVSYINYEHDRRGGDIRIIGERKGVIDEFISERQLKYEIKDLILDGLFISNTGKKIGIEIEMRLKKKYRNIAKFKKIDQWINDKRLNQVLYFCNTKHQINTLVKYTTNKDVYFTTYNSFKCNWEDTKFVNLKHDLIKFEDL